MLINFGDLLSILMVVFFSVGGGGGCLAGFVCCAGFVMRQQFLRVLIENLCQACCIIQNKSFVDLLTSHISSFP